MSALRCSLIFSLFQALLGWVLAQRFSSLFSTVDFGQVSGLSSISSNVSLGLT